MRPDFSKLNGTSGIPQSDSGQQYVTVENCKELYGYLQQEIINYKIMLFLMVVLIIFLQRRELCRMFKYLYDKIKKTELE